MTIFLRLLADKDKATGLLQACVSLREHSEGTRIFQVQPESFRGVPGAPFAYWVGEAVRHVFRELPALEGKRFVARQGGVNGDDFRWLRLWFEHSVHRKFLCTGIPVAKGGAFGKFYSDVHLVARWDIQSHTFHSFDGLPHRPSLLPASSEFYFRPGLTWPRRTQGGLSFRVLPENCIFADKGPAAFAADNRSEALLALAAIVNSQAFGLLVSLQMAFGSYEVGVIQRTPVPDFRATEEATLAKLAHRAWSLKRSFDTTEETSHAFLLPTALRTRLGDYDPPGIEAGLTSVQAEIDDIAFQLYGFSETDRAAAEASNGATAVGGDDGSAAADDGDDEGSAESIDQTTGLLSWAVGVAFGRFDWRLATGERAAPHEPEPFDPLPAKSPGMLPDGAEPFHRHAGILVDDSGHPNDLARLVEEVLACVDAPVSADPRLWLQRDFFSLHLQRYSRSRRKAPIYWPLSTSSGGYTLWLYYPDLTSQTLYTAVNDFVEPKLQQVEQEAAALRSKGSTRSRDEERRLEALQSIELDLIELRDELLQIAPSYRPNHDDGVQITAAPLRRLFRHKPWAKLLRETWEKLERGEYNWAHLAMAYWPEYVREKCRTDRSLAIAHDLAHLYEPPPETAGKAKRGRRKKG